MYPFTVPTLDYSRLTYLRAVCRETITFSLNISATEKIPKVVSNITLSGRQSKVIVTDYTFGKSSKVHYSTAQVLYGGQLDGRDVLFLYGDSQQDHEAALTLTGTPNPVVLSTDLVQMSSVQDNITTVSFMLGIEGLVTVYDSDTQLVLFADTQTAKTFWIPELDGTSERVLVGGPYLVRGASLEDDGATLALRGDLNETVSFNVFAPTGVTKVTWNGDEINLNDSASSISLKTAELSPKVQTKDITIPTLGEWKFSNSLPEIEEGFDDSSWAVANHTETNIRIKPSFGDGRVLYGCDYGL